MSNLLARGTARAFALRGEVGNGLSNDPEDVMAVKRQLARRGRYAMPADAPTGFIDRGMLDGIACR